MAREATPLPAPGEYVADSLEANGLPQVGRRLARRVHRSPPTGTAAQTRATNRPGTRVPAQGDGMPLIPVQVTFHGLAHSDALEADIREHVDWLEQFYTGIVRCRVRVEMPHRHRRD